MRIPSRTGVTTGVAPGPRHSARPPGRRGRKTATAGVALCGLGLSVFVAPGTASAAVPTFPDNVVVFPDRDFVSIEGYQDHVGETATVTVTRPGTGVVGQASGVVAAGDVAFEINHPGGICWGASTADATTPASLQVTPNIKAGDKVAISFADGSTSDTTTASGVASDAVLESPVTEADGVTVTVKGTLGSDVNRGQVEQRIINPDMVDLVGKRDVRALPGGLVRNPKTGPEGGYSSGMAINADGSYVATYVFDTAVAAEAAANAPLGERLMSWQLEDADANRQGLTIAEFGEGGGPGMGGCPLGAADSSPQVGTFSVSPVADGTQITWSPATAAADASAVTNYSVLALGPAGPNGEQQQTGVRLPASARTYKLPVLTGGPYTYEVRAITADGKSSQPFKPSGSTIPGGTQIPGAAAQLKLNPAPNPDGVTPVQTNLVTATTLAGTQVYFAADTAVFAGGALTDEAQPVPTNGVPITKLTTLHFAALNSDNNVETVTGVFTPTSVAPPAAPAGLTATGGMTTATVRWTNATSGVTGYEVAMTGPGTTTTPVIQTVAASPLTINNLTPGKYSFSVTALNGTQRSTTAAGPVTADVVPVTAKVTISSGRWKNADTRIQGTTDQPALASSVVRFYRKSADGTFSTVYAGPGALTAAVAPATGSTFDARFRTTALTGTTNPGQIVAKLFDGTGKELGASAPFSLTNG